ncbi:MAG: helix-turn-helix domain-containing protein [Pseudomonadota bacterium]|nr:helix-turn-helix domain-containing protein [Pseudomonadota bacterium]
MHDYTKVNRQAPAETDIARFFGLAPPSVHRMVVELVDRGLLAKTLARADSWCRAEPSGPGPARRPTGAGVATLLPLRRRYQGVRR